MIDTHVHLQLNHYANDLAQVLLRAKEAGVQAAVVPGTTPEDARAALALASAHSGSPCPLAAAVGIHPTSAHLLTDDVVAELAELAADPRVVAIGEIGLDYYWPSRKEREWFCAPPDVQRDALDRQLALAEQLDLPVIVHDRDAHDDIFDILRAWVHGSPRARGVLHSYAAGPDRLVQFLDLGFYIGMDGPVTYSKAGGLHSVARAVPLEKLLLETDGPYLTPAPHRGSRNEPAYLRFIAQRIAQLRDVDVQRVATVTTSNARSLFGLEAPSPDAWRVTGTDGHLRVV